MLIKDEAAIARHQAGAGYEQELQVLTDKARALKEQAEILDNPELDTTTWERQRGKTLTHEEFERRLLKICPNLVFVPHPRNETIRAVYLKSPEGALTYILASHSGTLSENSVMDRVYQDIYEPEALKAGAKIEKADIPKSEVKPHEFNADGSLKTLGSVDFGDALMPGQKRIITPYAEIRRGYRTVLALLIMGKLITVSDAEREFGSQNKASWAAVAGRRSRLTPW